MFNHNASYLFFFNLKLTLNAPKNIYLVILIIVSPPYHILVLQELLYRPFLTFFFFLLVIKVLLIRKVLCVYYHVYDSRLIALEANTNKSKGRANRNKEIKHGNTMRKTPNQIRDHSNKVLASKDFNRSIISLSMSSNVRVLRSFWINHIRHAGTIFQTFEE